MPPTESDTSGVHSLTVPDYIPGNLKRLLDRLCECQPEEADKRAPLLRDSLGFLLRFFANVGASVSQQLGVLSEEGAELWTAEATVGECHQLLNSNLDTLKEHSAHPFVEAYLDVFVSGENDTLYRDFAKRLGIGPDFEQPAPVVAFCRYESDQDLEVFQALLEEWLEACKPVFAEADFLYEAAEQFGRRELVVAFREHHFRTKMAVRLREARQSSATVGEQALAGPVEDLTSGLRELVSELSIVQEDTSSQKKAPGTPQLGYRVDYTGYAKNRYGRLGHTGKLILFNAGEGELLGTVESSNPNLLLTPGTFKGNDCRVSFWLDPDEMPQPDGVVEIRTDLETRRLPVATLLPRSRMADFGTTRLALMLLTPGLLGFLYLVWVFYSTLRRVEAVLSEFMRREYEALMKGVMEVSFRQAGVGMLDLEIQPRGEAAALLFLLVAVLCPLLVTKLFRHYPRNQQRDLGWAYMLGLVLPLVGFLALWKTPILDHPMLAHPELAFLDFKTHFPYFTALNLLASGYLFLSVSGNLDRWMGRGPARVLLPVFLFLTFLASVVVLVYGRSWLGL